MHSFTVAEIATICGGRAEGDLERVIRSANALEDARPDDLSFSTGPKTEAAAQRSQAGCLVVPSASRLEGSWSLIRSDDPRGAFAQVLAAMYPVSRRPAQVHPSAVIASTAKIGADCYIGPLVVIEEEAQIGSGCSLGAGCYVGENAIVGNGSVLHPNVTIYQGVQIGSRVIIHAGCVIGADGFGFVLQAGRYEKFPQIGTVILEDEVEIGANCCIDRAALGATRIGAGSKLDNLVHIAHNCVIGKHVVIAAQTGLSGGVVIGDYAAIGGQVGMGDKAKIASEAIVASKSGVLTGQTIVAGEPVWGIPARPLRQHLKGLANIGKVPELREELKNVKRRMAELESLSLARNESDSGPQSRR